MCDDAPDFGEYGREVSTLVSILTPLIPLSLSVFDRLESALVDQKSDGSVVTVADFAIQALIMSGISSSFPGDLVLGEEDLGALAPEFLSLVSTLLPAGFDPVAACAASVRSFPPGAHRVWAIDPIDGTEGFVRRGHYAIATALLVDREIALSVTAWPRHSRELTALPFDGPAIFVAARGRGAWAVDLGGRFFPVAVGEHPANRILYSDAKGRISAVLRGVMERIGFDGAVGQISMTKGFILASGQARVYIRRHPTPEKVWDVAPFELFVREAGCNATTAAGERIVYTSEGTVADSQNGLVFTAGDPEYHARVLAALRESVDARTTSPP
jgi:3'(2'), 5'-bisphosphate nucleotidase